MLNQIRLSCFMAVGLFLANSEAAYAQVYSSIYFSQGVIANAFLQDSFDPVVSDTVPIQQTATASTTYGAKVQAIYSVTDNGSVATFDINASGSVTPSDDGVTEGLYDQGPTQRTNFSFTVPVRYSVYLSESGAGSLDFFLSGGTLVSTGFSDSSRSYSGLIPANDMVNLSENWEIDNGQGAPTSQSGGDSIEMTFYATEPIPEPSSALPIGVSALALLARRRRVVRTSQW